MAEPGGPVSVADSPRDPLAGDAPQLRATGQAGQNGGGQRDEARGPATSRPGLRAVAITLLLLAAFVLGFAWYLYGLSAIQEHRDQATMFAQLRNELANGVAPLSQPGSIPKPVIAVTPGQPVAVLDIPAIGIHDMVVVDGTSAEDLTHGPGLLPGTVLPGQPGVSGIYGRRATFGAPFARLTELRKGNLIRVVTGEGTASYQVEAFGSSSVLLHDPDPNRLVLLTAWSTAVPTYYINVDAHLISKPGQYSGVAPFIAPDDLPLTGDTQALWLTAAWSLALAAVAAVGTIAAGRWSRWPAYLAVAPVALAVLWNLYQNLAMLLPNIY